jgi:argininosuccinate lyase
VVDTEDDLQPLVFSMFRDATRAVRLFSAAIASAEFDAVSLEAKAAQGWATLTELADTLVRDHGLPFSRAHAIASALVSHRGQNPSAPLSDALAAASAEIIGRPLRYSDRELDKILSPRHFVQVRRTEGGPASSETARAIEESQQKLATDRRWWADTMDALRRAETRLAERAAAL